MHEHEKNRHAKRESMAEFLRTKPMNHVLFGEFTVEDVYELVKYEQTYGPYVDPNSGDQLLLQMVSAKKQKKAAGAKQMNQMMSKMMGGGFPGM